MKGKNRGSNTKKKEKEDHERGKHLSLHLSYCTLLAVSERVQ